MPQIFARKASRTDVCDGEGVEMTYDDTPIEVDQPLVLIKDSGMEDWYCIERAEYDGKAGLDPIPGGATFMALGRISDADVEGRSEHMICIAEAIEKRGHHYERRCAVSCSDTHAQFWSPRNSMRRGVIPIAYAVALAKQIRKVLG